MVVCRSSGVFFFFKQKTAYEMRISDWSSDVCSSDLRYRDIVKAVMPQAAVVVDRWHVVRTAVESMRQARIAYQQTLEKEERKELQRCLWLFQKRWRRLTDQHTLDLDGWLRNHPNFREYRKSVV